MAQYVLDGHVTIHVDLTRELSTTWRLGSYILVVQTTPNPDAPRHLFYRRELSTTWRLLAQLEPDEKRAQTMHLRRVRLLAPLLDELNPKVGVDTHHAHVATRHTEKPTEAAAARAGRRVRGRFDPGARRRRLVPHVVESAPRKRREAEPNQ